MSWYVHHVNIASSDVEASAYFLRELIGIPQGVFETPGAGKTGTFERSNDFLAVFGEENKGIHVVKPMPTFAKDNGFIHNPTIGGHFALNVPDLQAVIARLEKAGIPYTDAGVYAMKGVHQIYVYDPSFNLIEINQDVG